VIGYGKVGGFELGYGSDLDLVFLHDSQGANQQTTGPKQIDNAVFFARVGQRFIHFLNTHTASGILYEVDMRLRPSGASGLLVTSLESFEQYQREEAWTWEHQALVRARAIVGDAKLIDEFNRVRQQVLCLERDADKLRGDVVEMRERMRAELGSSRPGLFHLKQDKGGMADIEFMVQYLVLRYAHQYPDVVEYTDNLRQLQALKAHKILSVKEADGLFDAYRQYRSQAHRLVLMEASASVDNQQFKKERDLVNQLWKRIMEPS
jgi:glutamate-ammonia-ligase adenylyltransferase